MIGWSVAAGAFIAAIVLASLSVLVLGDAEGRGVALAMHLFFVALVLFAGDAVLVVTLIARHFCGVSR